MNSKFILVVAMSAALHIAVGTFIFYAPSKNGAPKPQKTMAFHLLPPGDLSLVEDMKKIGKGLGSNACKGSTYNGIGMGFAAPQGMVYKIVPGGPADIAGLKIKDILLNREDYMADSLPVGTPVDVRVLRENRELLLHAHIDNICRNAQPEME